MPIQLTPFKPEDIEAHNARVTAEFKARMAQQAAAAKPN
jgi:hypothetical protein